MGFWLIQFISIECTGTVCVQDIYHERAWLHSRVDQVNVKCIVETTGLAHANQMFEQLNQQG